MRVMDNREEMVKMQKGFGEWNEDMSEVSVEYKYVYQMLLM